MFRYIIITILKLVYHGSVYHALRDLHKIARKISQEMSTIFFTLLCTKMEIKQESHVMYDIDLFGDGLLFVFLRISTSFGINIFVFMSNTCMQLKISLVDICYFYQ